MRISITAEGPLHNNPDKHFKAAVTKAVSNTANYGKRIVQSDTPVDSGLLKSKWFFTHTGWGKFELANRTHYAPYVEKRFQMLKRNEPLIHKELDRQLNQEINQALNG